MKFSRADSSAIEQAVSLLKQRGFGLKGKKCLVIGNGEYGRLAAVTLREQGADVLMTVRQYHHGLVHVPEGCQRVDYESRYEYLAYVDLAVSATSSPHCTIHREENEGKVEWFLKEYPEFELVKDKQMIPGKDTGDGFYIAIIKRVNHE